MDAGTKKHLRFARHLRAELLEEDVESETLDNGLDDNPGPTPSPGNHQPPLAPFTPRHQASGASRQPTPGSHNILFAPVVELRLNSPNSGSPGLVSPSRGRARALRNRVALGCQLLGIEKLSPMEVAEVEGILMGLHTSDAFVEAVGEVEDGSGFLTDAKALLVWDMYKML
ncbi:hypothetical protein BT96DRAFT_1005982 [Gymnopus androsaceus JB14]|uniref:Uncharacterized protein n=1 Tax=Gymnopus androsaceus JB14 TaxID=1447944 RepID=A0A6A4GMI3_9AGAR|nr:hypothetical protein BT96DRAFT_1005982 [Gymnopus androsaceus JB14]